MAQPGRDGITLPSDSTLTGKAVDSWSYQYWDWSPGGGAGALVTRWSQAATLVDTAGNVLVGHGRTGDSVAVVKDANVAELLERVVNRLDTLIDVLTDMSSIGVQSGPRMVSSSGIG